MSQQNRVNPFGELIRTDACGAFMGNRGKLHDERGELTCRRWEGKRWITCSLDYKGNKPPDVSYTKLFFLDEATALAAGHRPCAQCSRKKFDAFLEAWVKGNPRYGFTANVGIDEIDGILHRDRTTRCREKVTYEDQICNLPEGAFFALPRTVSDAFLIWRDCIWKWTPHGYDKTEMIEAATCVRVLTPLSTVNALRAGYVPEKSFFRV